MVPAMGIPYSRPARTLLVESKPARKLDRASRMPASARCARRRPKSSSVRPPATSTQRAALAATSDWKWISCSSTVSTSWPSSTGAVTSSTGSFGKKTVPSGSALTSPEKRSSAR